MWEHNRSTRACLAIQLAQWVTQFRAPMTTTEVDVVDTDPGSYQMRSATPAITGEANTRPRHEGGSVRGAMFVSVWIFGERRFALINTVAADRDTAVEL